MKEMEKVGLVVSCIIILLFLVGIIFSEHGILDYKDLSGKKEHVLQKIETLDRENDKLEEEVLRLKTDMDYIKHVAKQKYDMAEEGEIIFKTSEKEGKSTP